MTMKFKALKILSRDTFTATNSKTATQWHTQIEENFIFVERIKNGIFAAVEYHRKVDKVHEQKRNVSDELLND